MRSATKGFREIRIFSFIGGAITFPGSWSKETAKKLKRKLMFALSLRVFTTILQGLWVTLQVSRNTIAGNMERRNGSVRNAQRSMPFNQIGRLTLKPVEQESIDVTVEPFSPGNFSFFLFLPSLFILGFQIEYFFSFLHTYVGLKVLCSLLYLFLMFYSYARTLYFGFSWDSKKILIFCLKWEVSCLRDGLCILFQSVLFLWFVFFTRVVM